jgi:hypothetical protein
MDKERELFLQRRQIVYVLYDKLCEHISSLINKYRYQPISQSSIQNLRDDIDRYLSSEQSFSPLGGDGIRKMRENIKIDSGFSSVITVDVIDKEDFITTILKPPLTK